jgi:hypothetical protein
VGELAIWYKDDVLSWGCLSWSNGLEDASHVVTDGKDLRVIDPRKRRRVGKTRGAVSNGRSR